MSKSTIETPADILKLTHEYIDRRYEALAHELGANVLLMAIEETELEDAVTVDLSPQELSNYFLMSGSDEDQDTSPSTLVEDATERIDALTFAEIKAADEAGFLEDFRIEAVSPGRIVLMNGVPTAYGRMRGDYSVLSASVSPTTMELAIEKRDFKGTDVMPAEASEADQALVFRAANLLSQQLDTES